MIRQFLTGNLLLTVVNLTVGVCIARSIGPQGRGLVTLVGLWPTMMIYWLNCNLPQAMSYYIPRMTAPQRDRFAASALVFAFAIGAVAGGVLYLLAPRIFHGESAQYLPLIRVIVLLTPLGSTTEMATNILLALKDNAFWSGVRVVQPVLTAVGVGVCLASHSLSVSGVLILSVGSGGVMTLLIFARIGRLLRPALPGEGKLFRQALIYGLKSHVTSVTGSLNQSLDQLLLGTFVGGSALGVYSLAVNYTSLISPFASAASVGVLAHLSSTDEANRKTLAIEITRKSTTLLAVGALCLLLLAPCIPFVYGKAFTGATWMSLILLPGVFLRSIVSVLNQVLMAFNCPLRASLVELVGLVVTVPALLLLLPHFGGYGASFASALAYTAGWIVSSRLASRVLAAPVRRLLRPTPAGLIAEFARKGTV